MNSPSAGQPVKTAVLFSGRGSNLKSLAAHMARPDVPAELTLAVCNRPGAAGISFCETENIPCRVIDHKAYDCRAAFDAALDAVLRVAAVELVCCAGFMRLLTEDFVDSWHDRLINIHPSLLPKHKGLHTHQRALEAGDAEHGCTVHYMRPQMDDGPIIVQKRVPVLPDDTADSLADRVLQQEHIAYPEALDRVLASLTT